MKQFSDDVNENVRNKSSLPHVKTSLGNPLSVNVKTRLRNHPRVNVSNI